MARTEADPTAHQGRNPWWQPSAGFPPAPRQGSEGPSSSATRRCRTGRRAPRCPRSLGLAPGTKRLAKRPAPLWEALLYPPRGERECPVQRLTHGVACGGGSPAGPLRPREWVRLLPEARPRPKPSLSWPVELRPTKDARAGGSRPREVRDRSDVSWVWPRRARTPPPAGTKDLPIPAQLAHNWRVRSLQSLTAPAHPARSAQLPGIERGTESGARSPGTFRRRPAGSAPTAARSRCGVNQFRDDE